MRPSETPTPFIPAKAGIQGHDAHTAEVWAALATVADPELDESVVSLGFVTRVAVDAGHAEVSFRLPTFWCSASFAWIMAEDMRAALGRLPWLTGADIHLVDHFAAGKINDGIAAGQGFRAAFRGEATADLTALRETFRRKAYLGRMSRLIEALKAHGWSEERILSANIADLQESHADPGLAELVVRYFDLRAVYGGSNGAAEPAFLKPDGEAIAADGLAAFLRDIRMTRRSVEANGEMCRILLKARIEEPAPAESQAPEP
jgi:metal-sulfur cluster biosynthetic enzyme